MTAPCNTLNITFQDLYFFNLFIYNHMVTVGKEPTWIQTTLQHRSLILFRLQICSNIQGLVRQGAIEHYELHQIISFYNCIKHVKLHFSISTNIKIIGVFLLLLSLNLLARFRNFVETIVEAEFQSYLQLEIKFIKAKYKKSIFSKTFSWFAFILLSIS